MAADSMSFSGDIRIKLLRPKVAQRRDGAIIGCAGEKLNCDNARAWFLAGEDKDRVPEVYPANTPNHTALDVLILRPDGRVRRSFESLTKFHEVIPTFTVGAESACLIAEGAMSAGACARRAVEIAIEHCIWVGGQVQSISL